MQFARILYIFFLLPPLRSVLFSRLSTSSSVWSPVASPSEVYSPPADCLPNSLLLVSCPESRMKVCSPRPVRLVVLDSGMGGGTKETATPAMVLSSWTRRQASPGSSVTFVDALGPSLILVVPVSLSPPTPPLPLSPYNRTCPNTLPPNVRVFSWSLCAPSPRWTRPSCRPPERLRYPYVPPPPPLSLFHGHHLRGLVVPYRASSSVERSVGEPAPQARTTGTGYRTC